MLPAIQNAREAARRTQCLNNQKNIVTALHGWATAHRNQLPAYGYFEIDSSGPTVIGARSWAVELLAYVDAQGTADRWNENVSFADNTVFVGAATDTNLNLGGSNIPVFVCPNDDTAFQKPGGLSYVVNSGFTASTPSLAAAFDTHNFNLEPYAAWDGDATGPPPISQLDRDITQATGVFWMDVKTDGVSSSKNGSARLGRIYDGASNTIMMGENTKAGLGSDGTNSFLTWAAPSWLSCTFVLPVAATNDNSTFNDPVLVAATTPYPNQSKQAVDGAAPYLNSLHPGIVVIGLCDGSVRTLSDNIDQTVYSRLMTPDGTKLRGALFAAETPLQGTDF